MILINPFILLMNTLITDARSKLMTKKKIIFIYYFSNLKIDLGACIS
jgi:hypothetical protein